MVVFLVKFCENYSVGLETFTHSVEFLADCFVIVHVYAVIVAPVFDAFVYVSLRLAEKGKAVVP